MKITVRRSHCVLSLAHNGTDPIPLQTLLCDLEREAIAVLLEKHGSVKARVAEHLLLNRTTLVEKAKKYGFPLKEKGEPKPPLKSKP